MAEALSEDDFRQLVESPYAAIAANALAAGLDDRANQVSYWASEASDWFGRDFRARERGLDPTYFNSCLNHSDEVRSALGRAVLFSSGYEGWEIGGWMDESLERLGKPLLTSHSKFDAPIIDELLVLLGAQNQRTVETDHPRVRTFDEWDTSIGITLRKFVNMNYTALVMHSDRDYGIEPTQLSLLQTRS